MIEFLSCDCYGGCWGDHARDAKWPTVPASYWKYCVDNLPHGSFVRNESIIYIHPSQYPLKVNTRAVDIASIKPPAAHGQPPSTHDTLEQLRYVNVERCNGSFHSLDRWTPLEWAGAICGEAGEMANLCKKLRRGEDIDTAAIGKELADIIIYSDLLAALLGIDLCRAIRSKFNEVSERVNSPMRMPL